MSLYEALDRFVGAGVLATAGLVGAEMPAQVPLDGAALSRFLRERRLGDELGQVLDALAHEVWLAQERRGFPLQISEAMATGLAALLGEQRLVAGDLAAVLAQARDTLNGVEGQPPPTRIGAEGQPHKQLTETWIARTQAAGQLTRAGLEQDVARFLLERMFFYVVEQPRLLLGLQAALLDYRSKLGQTGTGPAASAAEPATQLTVVRAAAPPVAPVSNLPQPAAVAEIRTRHSLPEGVLRRFQAILARHPMSAEHRLARLDELAGWLMATVAHLRKPSNDAAEIRQIKTDAAAALERGDLECAMDHLKAVREHIRASRRRAEARLAEELQSLKAEMIDEAAATARLGELALARLDYSVAADFFADAAGQLPANHDVLEIDYRQRQAEALAGKAELSSDAHALQEAVQAFRGCRRLVSPQNSPAVWARINVGLGDMLVALAARSKEALAELEEAAAAFQAAASSVDRVAHPMQWALVKLSHAAALVERGARGDREQHWKAAATALMPALEVFESRGAMDLADAARARLRMIASGLQANELQIPACDVCALGVKLDCSQLV